MIFLIIDKWNYLAVLLRCPFCAQKLCLLQDELRCLVLQIRRVAVLSKNAFYQNLNLGTSAFA
jgi:hypothetical protein